jgi:glycosyltransferase involved in cell wall biosynthesis
VKLTIGMAAFKDFPQVWFTVQALRLYQDLADTEIVVVDNAGDEQLQKFIEAWGHGVRYVRFTDTQGTAAPRDLIFTVARGEWVIVIDSHVLLAPGTVARFRAWAHANPTCRDLLHGPLLYDSLDATADAMIDVWDAEMWGKWRTAHVAPDAAPYEIPMMGLGLFACRREAWLRFNPAFRGFGGEEGYIHEKYRQAGRKALCLPFLRWCHLFRHGTPVPYRLAREDKLHNYLTGFRELGLDPKPIHDHFSLPPVAV